MIPRGVTDSKTQAQSTQAILFDIDGTLIESGGASDRAWPRAFDELQGVDVQISKVTGKGVPDPAVGRQAFETVMADSPSASETTDVTANCGLRASRRNA
jgi:beta-phosphoglucomutase-like phosphatase (HAD superfamily)